MNCSQAEEFLQAHLDGELKANDAILLGEHLALCPACKSLFAELRQLAAAAARLPRHPAEGRIAAAVARAIPERATEINVQRPARAFRRGGSWFAGAAAAAVVLIALGLSMLLATHRRETNQSRGPEKAPGIYRPSAEESAARNDAANPAREDEGAPETNAERSEAVAVLQNLHEKAEEVSESERKQQARRDELSLQLQVPEKAGAAAKELAELARNENTGRLLWNLAMAVKDPKSGAEILKGLSELKPELWLAPVYISALDSGKTRQCATEMLRAISGQRFGPHKEVWLNWWLAAREQSGPVGGRGG